MKIIYLLLFCFLSFGLQAQRHRIPDTAYVNVFRAWQGTILLEVCEDKIITAESLTGTPVFHKGFGLKSQGKIEVGILVVWEDLRWNPRAWTPWPEIDLTLKIKL